MEDFPCVTGGFKCEPKKNTRFARLSTCVGIFWFVHYDFYLLTKNSSSIIAKRPNSSLFFCLTWEILRNNWFRTDSSNAWPSHSFVKFANLARKDIKSIHLTSRHHHQATIISLAPTPSLSHSLSYLCSIKSRQTKLLSRLLRNANHRSSVSRQLINFVWHFVYILSFSSRCPSLWH